MRFGVWRLGFRASGVQGSGNPGFEGFGLAYDHAEIGGVRGIAVPRPKPEARNPKP